MKKFFHSIGNAALKTYNFLNGKKTIIGNIGLLIFDKAPIPEPYKSIGITFFGYLSGIGVAHKIAKGAIAKYKKTN